MHEFVWYALGLLFSPGFGVLSWPWDVRHMLAMGLSNVSLIRSAVRTQFRPIKKGTGLTSTRPGLAHAQHAAAAQLAVHRRTLNGIPRAAAATRFLAHTHTCRTLAPVRPHAVVLQLQVWVLYTQQDGTRRAGATVSANP
jgi:hypothetical protein